jgi:sulfonate transport system substrate-binding protein
MNLSNDIAPTFRSFPVLRCFILRCFAATIVLAPIPSEAATLRIGYQKAASTLVLLRAHGTLEKKLAPLNVEVKWLELRQVRSFWKA